MSVDQRPLTEFAEFSNERMRRAYANCGGEGYYAGRSAKWRYTDVLRMVGKAGRVLDVGCYVGVVGAMMMRQGNEVYGIDAYRDGVEMAKQRGIKAQVASAEAGLPFEDAFFDAVYSMDVIEHIVDTDRYVSEMKRVLRPGGSLVITTPNVASLGRRLYLLLGKNPYLEASLTFPDWVSGHVRFFTRELLVDYLRYMNLEIEETCSDCVVFTPGGELFSRYLGKIAPSLGRTLIVKARKG
jgi:2-polyprenyl-3-methyl-5-hydroxy-6-metoxy-1,4-benzoquinol methylase